MSLESRTIGSAVSRLVVVTLIRLSEESGRTKQKDGVRVFRLLTPNQKLQEKMFHVPKALHKSQNYFFYVDKRNLNLTATPVKSYLIRGLSKNINF